MLRRQGSLPPDIAYDYAKSLLHRGRGADAVAAADEVPAGHPLALKAKYVRAVGLMKAHDLEGAAKVFETLAQGSTPSTAENAADVARLATLDRARLYLEGGLTHKSIELYQSIPANSPSFNDALFEQTWAQLDAAKNAPDEETRDAAFQKAQENLDLLLLDPNPTPLTPEAHLLSANLLLRVGRFEAADTAFADVVLRYQPVSDQLEALAKANPDATRIFIPDPNKRPEETGPALLPPLAAAFAADEKDLARAVALSSDLDQSETWLLESDVLVDKLGRALDAQERNHVSVGLQDVLGEQLELQANLVTQMERVAAIERDLVHGQLSSDQQAELASIAQEHATLDPAYRNLPRSKDGLLQRSKAVRDELAEVQTHENELKWMIREQQQQLDGLRAWVTDNPENFTPAGVDEVVQRVSAEESMLKELETGRGQLRTDIDDLRIELTLANSAQARDDGLRARYVANWNVSTKSSLPLRRG